MRVPTGTLGRRAFRGVGSSERGVRVEYPDDLKYTKEHEWARVEDDGRIRVGITDFAQDALGDVVYVDVPEVGTEVKAGQPFGEVESTKSVSDVYSPVTGKVVERNALLEERPELVNEQPYGDGWIVALELEDAAQLEGLLDADAYQRFVAGLGEQGS
jgi:glycine cleavage system H protein